MKHPRLLALAICLTLIPIAAMAAETIDASPIFNTAANALETVLYGVASVVVGWVGFFAKRFLGEASAQKTREVVESALHNGVNIIMREVRAKGLPLAQITVDNPAVAMGANYVIAAVPNALRALKIGNGEIAAKLIARIPAAPAP